MDTFEEEVNSRLWTNDPTLLKPDVGATELLASDASLVSELLVDGALLALASTGRGYLSSARECGRSRSRRKGVCLSADEMNEAMVAHKSNSSCCF